MIAEPLVRCSMARVALVVIWLGAAGMAGVLGFTAYELSRGRSVAATPMSIEKMPGRQPHNRSTRWSVTEHLSAHRVLIAHVETEFLHEAPAIARQLTEGPYDHGDLAWSADASEILVSANRHENADLEPNDSDLHAVDVATGSIRALTKR